ncbi:MAG: DUF1549 and DUF1553 domain-containing protein [Planctomycetia bacterium]|jgi:hypothetical protein
MFRDRVVALWRVPVLPAVLGFCLTVAPAAAAADGDSLGAVLPQVRFIDDQLVASWADAGLEPAASATDGEWCRRVHLDLVGRIPTLEELQRFLADVSPGKRTALVDRLLGDEYVDEYARHLTDVWTTVLIGRDVQNQKVSRPGMRQYLRRAFSKNIPYDRFMEELVTATGVNTNRKDVDGFNGATNFLSGKLEEMGVENAVQATAKTAQVFLGVQVQCTQCHNHPFNKGKQNQFWELNAFFRQTRALRRFDGSRDVQWIELVDQDWAGEGGNPEEAELYYELRNGQMKVAYPVFVDGREISKSGYLPGKMENGTPYGANRRRELATFIRTSPLFTRAIVNRVWGQFLGHGFTRPADDLGEHNPPSHPELLDGLATRFEEGGYDIKALIRWIVLSRAYGLSSRTTRGNAADDPALGEKPRFSRFYLRQMQAEQLYESLLTATQADRTAGSAEEAAKKKDQWLSQFVIAFGTDEGDDATTFDGSIPQVLMMFNGDLIKQATVTGKGGFLDAVSASQKAAKAKVEMLYLAALARKPVKKELAVAAELVKAREGSVTGALQDVWWALLNSNEFIINH